MKIINEIIQGTTVKTYLPIFTGYYCSYADILIENEEENIFDYLETVEEMDRDHIVMNINFDYQSFYQELSKAITTEVEQRLKELNIVESIEFEELRSPKFYNYSNDSINVKMNLSLANIKRIKEYLKEYSEEFEAQLREDHTSCSGFISFQANNSKEFLTEDYLNDEYKLGYILNFISKIEEIEEMEIYESIQEQYIELPYTINED